MKIIEAFLTSKKSRPRRNRGKTTKIAWHYIGNAGTSAKANRNFFNNGSTSSSSHYIIDLNGDVYYCVPENEIAYTTNSANAYSIGIEVCHPDSTGKFTEASYKAMVELGAYLCKKYKLDPIKDQIRHYDVTRKQCPLWFVKHPSDWTKFKNDVKAYMGGNTNITTNPSNTDFKNGTYDKKFKVKSSDGLTLRATRPDSKGNLGAKVKNLPNGTIIHIGYVLNGWGNVKEGDKIIGFVNMKYLEEVKVEQPKPQLPSTQAPFKNGDYKGADFEITVDNLRIRKGRPGQKNHDVILAKLMKGDRVDIHYVLNGWGAIYINGVCNPGFISMEYVRLL